MLMPRFMAVVKSAALTLSFSLMADTVPKSEIATRIDDAEADILILKRDLEQTKNLALQEQPNKFNPSISAVGDVMGQYGIKMHKETHGHDNKNNHDGHDHGKEFKNGVLVREIEFEFRAEVDPFADALIALGIHPNSFDHVDIHVEEGYVRLKKWPGLGYAPLGMIVKLGQFLIADGRANRIHLHNFPQITFPLAMRMFLGDEGHSAPGVSINMSFNPTTTSALNLFLEGVFNSKLPMQDEGAEKIPAGIFHAWWHQEISPVHFLDVGLSAHVARKGAERSGAFLLFANDIHYAYAPPGYGPDRLFLMGNEFFIANKTKDSKRWPIGDFIWAQMRIFGSSFFGLRYDLAPQEDAFDKFQHAASVYLTHYTTEFLRFRFGYEYVMPDIASWKGDHHLMLSTIFILGSHPVEPYFVNR